MNEASSKPLRFAQTDSQSEVSTEPLLQSWIRDKLLHNIIVVIPTSNPKGLQREQNGQQRKLIEILGQREFEHSYKKELDIIQQQKRLQLLRLNRMLYSHSFDFDDGF